MMVTCNGDGMAYGLKMFGNRRFVSWSLPSLVTSFALIVAAFLGAFLQPPVPDPFQPTGASFLNWLRYPIERNAHLRLPFISGYLSSITFSGDWRTGWIVGSDGTILKTEDGGETWMPRPSGTSNSLQSVTFAADGGRRRDLDATPKRHIEFAAIGHFRG